MGVCNNLSRAGKERLICHCRSLLPPTSAGRRPPLRRSSLKLVRAPTAQHRLRPLPSGLEGAALAPPPPGRRADAVWPLHSRVRAHRRSRHWRGWGPGRRSVHPRVEDVTHVSTRTLLLSRNKWRAAASVSSKLLIYLIVLCARARNYAGRPPRRLNGRAQQQPLLSLVSFERVCVCVWGQVERSEGEVTPRARTHTHALTVVCTLVCEDKRWTLLLLLLSSRVRRWRRRDAGHTRTAAVAVKMSATVLSPQQPPVHRLVKTWWPNRDVLFGC